MKQARLVDKNARVKRMPRQPKPQQNYEKVAERLANVEVPQSIIDSRECDCCGAEHKAKSEAYCPAYLWPRYSPTYQVELPEQTTNHLIYHIYPRIYGDVSHWRHNVEQLTQAHRWQLFNGLKRIAIVTDKNTESPDVVRQFFADRVQNANEIEYLIERNNPSLREVATFVKCLKPIAENYRSEGDLTFSAHAKGIKYSEDLAVRREDAAVWKWIQWMYVTTLDQFDVVRKHLASFPFAGSFKRYGQFQLPKNFKWHYSGTFYWMRNKTLFDRKDWNRISQQWFGTEAYPAQHFDVHETSCLFADNADDLYTDSEWERLKPEIELYEAARRETANCI